MTNDKLKLGWGSRLEVPIGMRIPSLAIDLIEDLAFASFKVGRDEQLDYFYAFQALEEAIGDNYVSASVYCNIAPQLAHDHTLLVNLPEAASPKIQRAKTLLGTWLEAREYDPLCACRPYDE